MKNRSGFTLFEAMIVIAVVSILMAIAVPNVITWRKDAAFRGTVNTLKSDLAVAKQAAIKHNSNVVVKFEANGAYTIFVDNGEGGGTAKDGIKDDKERIVVQRTATPAVSTGLDALLKNEAGEPVVVFNAKGLSTAGNTVSVTLTAGSKSSRISINRVGKIGVTW